MSIACQKSNLNDTENISQIVISRSQYAGITTASIFNSISFTDVLVTKIV